MIIVTLYPCDGALDCLKSYISNYSSNKNISHSKYIYIYIIIYSVFNIFVIILYYLL